MARRTPPTVSDDDLRRALAEAQSQVDRRCRTQAQRDRAADEATDAILRAAARYRPGRQGFAAYARPFVALAVLSVVGGPKIVAALRRRQAAALADEAQVPAPPVRPAEAEPFRDLPPDLRHVCTLYIVHDYTVDEVAALSGCGADEVRVRLKMAAIQVRRAAGCRGFPPPGSE